MKLLSLLPGVDVFWRTFDWNDDSHVFGNDEGIIRYGQILTRSGSFQMELRRNNASGPFIIPSDNHVYHDNDDLVLEADGQAGRIRSFIHPILSISSPGPNANLDQSR